MVSTLNGDCKTVELKAVLVGGQCNLTQNALYFLGIDIFFECFIGCLLRFESSCGVKQLIRRHKGRIKITPHSYSTNLPSLW